MKTKNFIKNFIRVSIIVLAASVQIACSKDKKDNNNNNGYYGQNCVQTQQYPNQQYPNQQYPNQYPNQQYPYNQNCGGYGGNGGMGQPQQCFGYFSTQPNNMGQSGYCNGQNCAGYLLYNQYNQAVQCI